MVLVAFERTSKSPPWLLGHVDAAPGGKNNRRMLFWDPLANEELTKDILKKSAAVRELRQVDYK